MDAARQSTLHAAALALEPATLDLLAELVAINSHSRHRAGVLANAALVRQAFAPLGFVAEQIPSDDPEHGDHLLLRRAGRRAGTFHLVSHLDTVYTTQQERDNQFTWRQDGDLIYGPGVADIKGGTALIWLLLRLLSEQFATLFEDWSWQIMFNAAEEEGNRCFPTVARARVAAADPACLVFEPGHRDPLDPARQLVTTSRRGSARFVIEALGREAHAGSGHRLGINAIRQLARLTETIESLTEHSRGLTFNVGIFQGGVASNTVPGHALIQVDTRAETPSDQAWQIERLLALGGNGDVVSIDDPRPCRITVTAFSAYPPWPANAASQLLADRAIDAANALGIRLGYARRAGASDGNHLWDLVPTLCSVGPIGANIHCSVHDPDRGLHQESVERSSFVSRALLLCGLLAESSWLG